MQITTYQAHGRVPVTVLQPHGDLDAHTYRQLIATAQEAWNGGARDMVLDLGDVHYLSSSGLVAIHTIARLLHGGEPRDPSASRTAIHAVKPAHERAVAHPHLRLLSPRPSVDRVLTMTGFRRMFDVHADLDLALASF